VAGIILMRGFWTTTDAYVFLERIDGDNSSWRPTPLPSAYSWRYHSAQASLRPRN